jgi:hypothetical protein
MFDDSQISLEWAHDPTALNRTKHIDIKHHFTREAINRKTVQLNYLCGERMIAFVLTKPIPKENRDICIKGLVVMLK